MENIEEGAKTPEITTDTDVQSTPKVDYEAKYQEQLVEIEKLKKAISKTNSENAEYKRKEAEKMTDEEKKAKDYEELVNSKNAIETELAQMKLEKEVYAKGFTEQECEKLKGANIPLEAVSVIAEIVKAKVEEAIKSTKAELIKNSSTPLPMGSNNGSGNGESDFQKYQKSKQVNTNEVKL